MSERDESIRLEEMLSDVRKYVRGRSRPYRARFGTSDVVQECAVQLIQERQPMETQQSTDSQVPKSWLFKIGRGVASKMRRFNDAKCRAINSEAIMDVEQIGSDESGSTLKANATVAALVLATSGLDSHLRKIIDMHYRQRLSLREIACRLKLHPKAIQRQHKLALNQLKKAVSDSFG